MNTKSYSSYAEIDRDLEILKLERQIHREKLKLGIENAKENLKIGNVLEGYLEFSSEQKTSSMHSIVQLILPLITNFIRSK